VKFKVGDIDTTIDSTIGVRQGSCEGPALFLFIIQAALETMDWPVAKPEFCTLENGVTEGQRPRKRGVTRFEHWKSLFADDCAVLFNKRRDLVKGANYLFTHLGRFGLQMHIGRGNGKSKTEAMHCPAPHQAVGNTRNFPVADGFVSFTSTFKYLGSVVSSELTSDADVAARLTSAAAAFGALRKCMFSSRRITPVIKGKVYVALVLTILLYGSECWCVRADHLRSLQSFHRRCVRAMCRVTMRSTKKHRITTESLLERLGIRTMEYYLTARTLRWAGHVARMDMDRLPRKLLTGWVDNKRPVGRPKLTYGHSLKKALKSRGLPYTFNKWCPLAQDRLQWSALSRGDKGKDFSWDNDDGRARPMTQEQAAIQAISRGDAAGAPQQAGLRRSSRMRFANVRSDSGHAMGLNEARSAGFRRAHVVVNDEDNPYHFVFGFGWVLKP
jgi:hypothetical protein